MRGRRSTLYETLLHCFGLFNNLSKLCIMKGRTALRSSCTTYVRSLALAVFFFAGWLNILSQRRRSGVALGYCCKRHLLIRGSHQCRRNVHGCRYWVKWWPVTSLGLTTHSLLHLFLFQPISPYLCVYLLVCLSISVIMWACAYLRVWIWEEKLVAFNLGDHYHNQYPMSAPAKPLVVKDAFWTQPGCFHFGFSHQPTPKTLETKERKVRKRQFSFLLHPTMGKSTS